MVRHVVSWNFKPELTPEERQTAKEVLIPRLTALKELVPCVLDLKVFCPPLDSSNCDLVLYSEVAQPSDLPVYQNHPDHQDIFPLVAQYLCDRRCCDVEW